jgi:hypothetical protein
MDNTLAVILFDYEKMTIEIKEMKKKVMPNLQEGDDIWAVGIEDGGDTCYKIVSLNQVEDIGGVIRKHVAMPFDTERELFIFTGECALYSIDEDKKWAVGAITFLQGYVERIRNRAAQVISIWVHRGEEEKGHLFCDLVSGRYCHVPDCPYEESFGKLDSNYDKIMKLYPTDMSLTISEGFHLYLAERSVVISEPTLSAFFSSHS